MINVVWHLELFGGFRAIRVDSSEKDSQHNRTTTIEGFRSQKTTALLAYLAIERRAHRRELLSEKIWPEAEDSENARNSLRVAVHNLKKILEKDAAGGQIITATRESVGITDAVSCDVHQFEELYRQGTELDDERALELAISLVKGPLLQGFYEEWISPVSARLEEDFLKATRQLIRLREDRGDIVGALNIARHAVTAAPARKSMMREVVRLGVASGEKESVRQEFEVWRKAAKRLGIENILEWNAFANLVAPPVPKPKTPTPLKAPSTGRGTLLRPNSPQPLPRSAGNFVGRKDELKQLIRLFSARHKADSPSSEERDFNPPRLVTLTGIGGIGKTRLALEAAHVLEKEYAAVLWVPLANLPSLNLLYGAILDAAGVTGPEKLDYVLSTLENLASNSQKDRTHNLNAQRVLLLLDNCEQLSEGTSGFVDALLRKMSALSIMATSLGSLQLSYEQTFPVSPLGEASADLFIERAKQARPDLHLDEENTAIIAKLGKKLNGLPLAIEIAAARLSLFTPAQMLEALCGEADGSGVAGNSFLDWPNVNRDAPGRHRSLRQTIGWSARQLSPAAASFWAKLSIFPESFTLDAAASICRESQAPSLLLALRDCSLLSIDLSSEIPRGVWIESLRQFAASRLPADQREELRAAYSQYFLHLAETLAIQLDTPKAGKAMNRLDLERIHFRNAADYFLERSDGETLQEREDKLECALRLCAALSWYWEQTSHLAQGRIIIEETLKQVLADSPSLPELREQMEQEAREKNGEALALVRSLRLRARVLESAGKLANHVSDHESAESHIEKALRLFRLVGDDAGAATCLYALGFGAMQRGDLHLARKLCEQSVALTRKLKNAAALGDALYNLALVAVFGGDFETVKELSREGLQLHRTSGDRRGIAISLENLGLAGLLEGNPDIAETYYTEALTSFEALGEGASVARCQWGLGHVERFRGNNVKARNLFRRAMMLTRETQNLWAVPFLVEAFGYLAASEGDLTKATQLLGGAAYIRELQGEPLPSPQLQDEFEATCASLRAQLGENLFDAHWETGRVIERDDLIDMTIDEED